MQTFPKESVDLVMFSPPYWGLRDYGIEVAKVWGGKVDCEHEWGEEQHKFHSGTKAGEKQLTNRGSFHNDFIGQHAFCVKCGAWKGQLGLEPHPNQWISHMVEVCRGVKRVLKKSGSLYLNVGDTYFSSASHSDWSGTRDETWFAGNKGDSHKFNVKRTKERSNWLQPKQLLLMPSRLAIALQSDGWILRNDIIWNKPNHMPSSVKDRLTNAYEHIFHMVKSRRYFYDLDAIRQPHKQSTKQRLKQDISQQYKQSKANEYFKNLPMSGGGQRKEIPQILAHMKDNLNPLGKNPSDIIKHDVAVGRVGNFSYSDPLHTKATHPKDKNPSDVIRKQPNSPHGLKRWERGKNIWEERFAQGGKNPSDILLERGFKGGRIEVDGEWLNDICPHCGRTMRRHFGVQSGKSRFIPCDAKGKNPSDFWSINTKPFPQAHFATFPPKICEAPIKSSCPDGGIVLDPMCGAGTTLVVAQKLGRRWIGIDLKPEYCEMAKKRLMKECSQKLSKFLEASK